MEQESIRVTSAVFRVIRPRVVSRSRAAPMARLISRRAASSASFRRNWVRRWSSGGGTRSVMPPEQDARSDTGVVSAEESLPDLEGVPRRRPRLVDGERSLLRIGRHRHVLDVHDLPVAVDERDGERDEGVLHPEPPALLLFKD